MTDILPPGPWGITTTAVEGEHPGTGHVYINDAEGRKIMCIWGPKEQKIALADFIIRARENEK